MDYDRNDALLHWLFRQTQGDAWFRPNEENISSGVALRVNDSMSCSTLVSLLVLISIGTGPPEFRVFPYENANLEPFETAVAALNPVVAVKVRNAAVHAALAEVYVVFLLSCLQAAFCSLKDLRSAIVCRLFLCCVPSLHVFLPLLPYTTDRYGFCSLYLLLFSFLFLHRLMLTHLFPHLFSPITEIPSTLLIGGAADLFLKSALFLS